MQIDVIKLGDFDLVRCNLYTGDRCVSIVIKRDDYNLLIGDGFFIRDGKEPDSAGVLNTTREYELKK